MTQRPPVAPESPSPAVLVLHGAFEQTSVDLMPCFGSLISNPVSGVDVVRGLRFEEQKGRCEWSITPVKLGAVNNQLFVLRLDGEYLLVRFGFYTRLILCRGVVCGTNDAKNQPGLRPSQPPCSRSFHSFLIVFFSPRDRWVIR